MKIHTLRAHNFRGLVDLKLEPNGRSMVLCGPNGAGKTAVVEAIEFVLAGKVRRFQHRGENAPTLQRHGAHIEHRDQEQFVEAEVVLPSGARFHLKRSLDGQSRLKCKPAITPELEAALDIARQGHHALSRDQLLRYITVTPGQRATAVQELLAIDRILELVELADDVGRKAKAARAASVQNVERAQQALADRLGMPGFDEEVAAEVLNIFLDQLGLPHVSAGNLRLPSLAPLNGSAPSWTGDAELLQELCNEDLSAPSAALARNSETFARDPGLLRDLDQHDLFAMAAPLLGEAKACPLCDTRWQPEDLRELLQRRTQHCQQAAELMEESKPFVAEMRSVAEQMQAVLAKLARKLPKELGRQCATAAEAAQRAAISLQDPRVALGSEDWQLDRWLPPPSLRESLGSLPALPALSTARQDAVVALTEARVLLEQLDEAIEQCAAAKAHNEVAQAFRTAMQEARNDILGGLYSQLADVFSRFYRKLHDHEGDGFRGEFKQSKNTLALNVDYLGKGKYPPAALHSEGHQDSMGLCLYLALMQRLAGSRVQLTVLDDVVSSVDADHRRGICELLKDEFEGRQFFITTHDALWAKQLQQSGLVRKAERVVLKGWTLQHGPLLAADGWEQIAKLLAAGDVNQAAAALRYVLEEELAEVCDLLCAKVRFRGNGLYGFDELFQGACQRFSELLDKARAGSQSHKRTDALPLIEERRVRFEAARKDAELEQWILNQAVHHNTAWVATAADLTRLFNAARRFSRSLSCECGVFIGPSGQRDKELLACSCGKTNWPLSKARLVSDHAA